MTEEEKAKLSPEELAAYEEEQAELKKKEEEERAQLKERDEFKSLIKEELAPMKKSMDRMAKERDEALKKLADIEEKERLAKIQKMKDEGKESEAHEAEVAELKAQLEAKTKAITELTRDQAVKDALDGLEGKAFKNSQARSFVFKEVIANLVQDEDGNWAHATGLSIQEFVKKLSTQEEYDFLFEIPENYGAQTPGKPGTPVKGDKPIKDRTPAELIQMARQGKLGTKSF